MKEQKPLTDEEIRKAVLEQIVEILDDYWIAVKNGNLHWDKEDEFWFFDSLKGLIHKSIDLAIIESRKSTISEVVKKIDDLKFCKGWECNECVNIHPIEDYNRICSCGNRLDTNSTKRTFIRKDLVLEELKKALCSQKSELERGLETSVSDSSRMGVSNDGEKPCADKQEESDSK